MPDTQPSTDWDAIRVPRFLGLTALDILGSRCGAVVDDPTEMALYWLIPAGSGTGWDVGTTRLDTERLTIPPRRRTRGPGPHWRMCPGEDRWLTDANALRAALEDALGPRPPEVSA
ncbi:hypothetical protein [Streptomyces sp. IB2014 016-6]|uniref:hypothetical protein n=1 Tax=Streptomyces sp. IB2014 016-6 TaxID=2517818 RepID=UPI0011CC4672|nr:hypothetical protein [Streptomyces sp. IB2014 016-6]TXL91567.1 hypothetical protein EW053_04370 [Streptomyces sp. IB2014 016-6]